MLRKQENMESEQKMGRRLEDTLRNYRVTEEEARKLLACLTLRQRSIKSLERHNQGQETKRLVQDAVLEEVEDRSLELGLYSDGSNSEGGGMDNNKEVLVDRSLAKTTATAEDGPKDFLSRNG